MSTTTSQRSIARRPLKKTAPTLPASSLMGNLAEFRADILGLLTRTRELGDVARVRILWKYFYLINDPESIAHVLVDNHRNYSKDPIVTSPLKELSGQNIVTGEGDFWRHRRRLMQPAFHREQIASIANVMTQAAQELTQEWEARPAGQILNVAAEMMRVTLNIVGRALFGVDLTREARHLGAAFAYGTDYIRFRACHPLYPPLRFPTARNRRAQAIRKMVLQMIEGVVRERIASSRDRTDLLSLLMKAKDEETGKGLTEDELQREIMIMIFAGHESTSNTLAWTWYQLSQNPDVEEKLHAEVDQLQGRAAAMDDLPHLHYTRRVIDETLRLYPPIWAFGRQSLAADSLGSCQIPAKALVLISPYTMHRHPKYWKNPEAFDPDRFEPANVETRPRYVYIPFSVGPRICMGHAFAATEAALLLATIAQRYRLRLAPNAQVKCDPQINLRIHGGLPMILTPR